MLGEAEIHQSRISGQVDHDVARLDIAVDDALGMGVVDGGGNGRDKACGDAKGEVFRPQFTAEGRPFDVLADDKRNPPVLLDVVDRDNSGVAETGRVTRFA